MKSNQRFNAFIAITCLLINVVAFNLTNAQPVDTVQAKLVAKNFFTDRLSRSRQMKLKSISTQNLEMLLVHEEKENFGDYNNLKNSNQTLPLYYVFNMKDKINTKDKNGFVIVSADQRVPAILGYSFTGEFSENDQAPAFKNWMDHYKEQIIYIIRNNVKPVPEISNGWNKYSSTIELKSTEQLSEVAPLLTTKWNQNGYCNSLCPADASCTGALNGHVPAGCVTVAMAQIMKYWNYPAENNLIPGYISTNYGPQPEIGVTAYDWSNMTDNIDRFNPDQPTPEEIDAVSTLIYHCGVAVQMNYGPPPTGSGAGSPLDAFKDYFKYSQDIQDIDKSEYSDTEWEDKLRNELDNIEPRPVYYSGYNETGGEGHAFVCDGYQGTNFFHFNWGSGPGPDGYYYLYDLTPGNHNYTFKQWAIIGISPVSNLTITDADANQYNIVTIGTQTWMAENLKTTTYCDGTPIPNVTENSAWIGLSTDAYCWYNNDAANYMNPYGALYNWYAVNTDKLCPVGWDVPSGIDWTILNNYLIANGYNYDGSTTSGNNYAKALASTTLWTNSEETGAVGNTDYSTKRNATGFTAVPSGFRSSIGPFSSVGEITAWWSSTRYSTEYPGARWMAYSTPNLNWVGLTEQSGNPVRCLKDATVVTLPGDAGAYTYGNIGTAGEEKWYRFLTGMAGTYAIQTCGSTDTYMYLYDSDKTTKIAEDNDGAGSGHNAKIVQDLSANTWFYVKISGYDNRVTGGYSIGFIALSTIPTAGITIDASQSCNPVPVGTSSITLKAKVSDASSIPLSGIEVWFSIENGNNQITNYPAVITDDSGIANLALTGLTSKVDVLKVTAITVPGSGDAAISIAYLAIYDPTGGFVTGGGWIISPAGAYRADPALTGKANFGFVSKYKKGSNVPDGNTEFQFHEGSLNFSSSSYDPGSLVIAGYKAIYKGVGTINGTGNYNFMVSAIDGDMVGGGGYDKFRIKIWNKTDNSVIYDNNLGRDENDEPLTALKGGSIVIHKTNENKLKSIQLPEFGLNVYPNPFTDHVYFDLQLKTDSKVCLEIYDMKGSKIATVYNDIVAAFVRYRFEYVPENSSGGTLSYRLMINGQQMSSGKLIQISVFE